MFSKSLPFCISTEIQDTVPNLCQSSHSGTLQHWHFQFRQCCTFLKLFSVNPCGYLTRLLQCQTKRSRDIFTPGLWVHLSASYCYVSINITIAFVSGLRNLYFDSMHPCTICSFVLWYWLHMICARCRLHWLTEWTWILWLRGMLHLLHVTMCASTSLNWELAR